MGDLEKYTKLLHHESTLLRRRSLGTETIELEVKLGVTPGKSGTNSLWWLNAYKYCRKMTQERRYSQFVTQISRQDSIDFRMRQYKDMPEAWQVKSKINEYDISDQWARATLSTEAASHKPTFVEQLVTRYTSRHTFFINNARLDFSKVYSDDLVTYELEAEFNFDYMDRINKYINVAIEYIDAINISKKLGGKSSLVPPKADKLKPGDMSDQEYAELTYKYARKRKQGKVAKPPPGLQPIYIKDFIELCLEIIASMFQTPLPFTYTQLRLVSTEANTYLASGEVVTRAYLERSFLSEASALDINTLNQQSMFRDQDKKGKKSENINYNVTLKADGDAVEGGGRHTLIIGQHGTWLVFPPHQARLLAINEDHLGLQITIVEGELIGNRLWMADSLVVEGTDVRPYSQTYRLEQFIDYLDRAARLLPTIVQTQEAYTIPDVPSSGKRQVPALGNIQIWRKPITLTNNYNHSFFDDIINLYDKRHACGFPVDGLIFTPLINDYRNSTKKNPIIKKWKPVITIDFKVKRSGNRIDVYVVGEEHNDVLFTGSSKSKFIGGVDLAAIPYNENSIVEFKYDQGNLVAFRDRPEKAGANSLITAQDNWEKMSLSNMQLSYETLMGRTNELMKKYHNRIKWQLLAKGQDLVLLDLGSGRGGDLKKWADYKMVICVEPNLEYIEGEDGFNVRLSQYPRAFQRKVHILNASGQDTKKISDFIKFHTGDTQVDVISMMDSLTFFFDPARKELTQLAKTVNKCLKPGGKFVWKMLDGDKLRNKFRKLGSNIVCNSEYNSDGIEWVNENQVRVTVAPWVNQVEYISSVHDLKTYLGLSGTAIPATNEDLMSRQYREFSELYSYGTFTLEQGNDLPLAIFQVFGSYIQLEPKPSASVIEAIESIFTDQPHSKLLEAYWQFAKGIDTDLVTTEVLRYTRFESAYRSRLVKRLFEGEAAKDIIYSAIDDTLSFALANMLGLDVYLVNSKMKRIQTTASKDSERPAVIVQFMDYAYNVIKDQGSSIVQYDSEMLQNYAVLASEDAKELFVSRIPPELNTRRILDMTTNAYPRLFQLDNITNSNKLNILANLLLSQGRATCTPQDLTQVSGLKPERVQKDVDYTNAMMAWLKTQM